MSRHSHVLLLVFICSLFVTSYFPPSSNSQGILRSLSLNGTNQYATAPSSTSLNITGAITVEGWVKLNSTGAYQAIVSREAFQQTGTGGGYRLVVTDLGKLRLDLFQSHNTYTTAIGTTTITTGVWHHVAGVFDGGQMRVYVDGVLNGSVSTTNGPASGTGAFYLGRFSYSFNPYYFVGLIDEVRVSAAALYTSNFTPGLGAGSNVRGLWKFDGQTLSDSSGNGNHATAQNGAGYSIDVPPATNNAPSVSLTHPLNKASFAAGSNIVLDATASDGDGNVAKVDFYQGTTLLGTDTSAPYTFVWSGVPAGNYSLTAKATDDGNATTTSSAVAVTVIAAGGSNSLLLNGTSQYVTAPSSTSLNITGAITVESWIKLNSIGAYQAIVSREAFQQSGTGGGYRLVVTDLGKLRLDLFQSHNTYTTAIGTTTITTGAWHHVAGVFDGSQMRVYVDGVLNGSVSTTNGPASGSGGLYIGRFSYSLNPYYFGGLIDDVRVSAAALYTSNFTPGLGPGSNVRGLWKFDGQTLNDFSGNGNHGTAQNGAGYSIDVPATGGGGSQPPVSSANGPYSGQAGQSVSFSSSGSADPGGTIVSYLWNFGDGTSASTANPSHTYAGPGVYTATLTVTDNSGLLASDTASVTISSASNARLDPLNQTGGGGENPLSRNFNWTSPLVGLPGRAGMDLNLSLSYNSLVWTKTGSYIAFDDDHGFPSPGFRLGFPVIQPLYFSSETGKYAHLLISSDGSRTELQRVGTSALYEAADSSYLLLDASTMVLRTTGGTQLKYELKGSDFQCTELKDRNGNYITVNYTNFGRIDTVIDTLGRSIKFNYDANGWLTSITQIWNQGTPSQVTHNWASFEYVNTTIQTNFTGLTVSGPSNGSAIKTLAKVTLADSSHYDFSYTSWGQAWKVSSFAADNHLLNYRSYNLPQTATAQTDCPRFTERRDWAENWNENVSGVEQEAITTYAPPVSDIWTMPGETTPVSGLRAQVTAPDLTSNKIYFIDPSGTTSDWQRGLPALVNTYDSSGTLQRQVRTTWTQDNTAVAYELNPRVLETNTYDPAGNRARVQLTYQQLTFANGTSCHLPRDVYEYAANATTILRSTRTDYHAATTYSDRRIIGLVTEKRLYEGEVNNAGSVLMSKVGFYYDNENNSTSIQGTDAPVQHDNTNYTASFVTGRANLSSVRRYDVTNTALFTTTRTKFNTAGAPVSNIDASNHTIQLSYTDSFSDNNNSRNTLAYATTTTDPDGYTATVKFHFDFGAVTYRRTPQPNTTQNLPGPEQISTYDAIGRLQQITNQVNGAYTRFVYPNTMTRVDTYATIQDGLGEAYSFKYTDGAGRVIATATTHPGSIGGYSGQKFIHDVMGRVIKSSNPTETNASGEPSQWPAAGDDAAAGWIYSQQTYDWKGRPLVTTNQDGTTKTASYTGCGCAGGEVVTLTDEGTIDGGQAKRRQQKIYSDVLGRPVKTEILNWENGSVYSATINTYNARDQVTQTRQYAGAEGSSTYQDTIMSYDGHGRLQSRHVPEQDLNTATVWTYNSDDTVNTVTDARGAVATYAYAGTNRHLVKTITYTLAGRATINVSYMYDAVGNRIAMTDGLGSVTYTYNDLSQLTSETRAITGFGNFTLNYTYNLSGQLSSVTDPFGAEVGYAHDSVGRLSAVTGANFSSVSTYASGLRYRAWGALKSLSYGNSKALSLSYDENLRVSTYEVPGLMKKSYEYYDDGRVQFTQDQTTTNSHFDRLYKYDHMGRTTIALSGAEARGQGPTDDRPYNETMTYDALGHLTRRELRHWDRYDLSAQTYVNNRAQYWQHDADGRLLGGISYYTYDAAGQISTIGDGDPYETDQQLDGDGRRVKSTLRSFDPNTSQWTSEKVTYYVHSSVLGEVISEVSGQGAKERSFVFAHGQVMAIQTTTGGEAVNWQHYDASGASYRSTNSQGQPGIGKEMDPMGANAGTLKPFSWPQPTSPGRLESLYEIPELNSAYDGCEVDGIPMICEEAAHLEKIGAGKVTVVNPVDPSKGGRRRPTWARKDTSYGTSDLETNTVTIYSGAGGEFVWVDEPGRAVETLTQVRRIASTLRIPLTNFRKLLEDTLAYGDCADFLARLLTKAGELSKHENDPVSTDMMAIYRLLHRQGRGGIRLNHEGPYFLHTDWGLEAQITAGGSGLSNGGWASQNRTIWINVIELPAEASQSNLTSVPFRYVQRAIHELFHVASRGITYSHTRMAESADALEPGLTFEAAVNKHCIPREMW